MVFFLAEAEEPVEVPETCRVLDCREEGNIQQLFRSRDPDNLSMTGHVSLVRDGTIRSLMRHVTYELSATDERKSILGEAFLIDAIVIITVFDYTPLISFKAFH